MNPRWIAWLTAGLPFFAVHLAYALSVQADYAPACVPYVEGCTSISRAARHGLPNLLFKALMLPHAAGLALFWVLVYAWLGRLRPDAPRRRLAILWLGVIAALFLVLYATFLGAEGKTYQWLRRYGITVYFSFTVLAEMMAVSLLRDIEALGSRLRNLMLGFCGLLLGLGLLSLPLQHLVDDAYADAAVNALEWTYALLMTGFYLLIARAWQLTGFRLGVTAPARGC